VKALRTRLADAGRPIPRLIAIERVSPAADGEVGRAVDDSRVDRAATPKSSVDRLSWDEHARVLRELRAHVDDCLAQALTS